MKENKITYDHGKFVNIYIVCEISRNISISDYLTAENCLFGTINLTKNAEYSKHKYSGYGIGFDRHWFYWHPSGGAKRIVMIFRVDMSPIYKDWCQEKRYFNSW